MVKITSQSQLGNITAINLSDDLIIVGEGGDIFTYSIDTSLPLNHLNVFAGSRVHGIASRPVKQDKEAGQLAVFGGKQLTITSVTSDGSLTPVTSPVDLRAWLLDVAWLEDDDVAVLDGHGRLLRVSTVDNRLSVMTSVRCQERCILYSGAILGPIWDQLVVLCGTVFCQVLVWLPADDVVAHRLTGHRGVIFHVSYDPARQVVVSKSDDRSVRLWRLVSEPDSGHVSPPERWRRGHVTPAGTMFGHEARVWRALVVGDRVVSVGEDSCVCVWSGPDGRRLERRWRTHHGASVRALAYCPQRHLLVTGGGDGGLLCWPLHPGPEPPPHPVSLPRLHAADFPRSVTSLPASSMTSIGRQLVLTDGGRLLLVQLLPTGETESEEALVDSRFSSYGLVSAAPDGKHVTVASIHGDLVTLRTEDCGMVKMADQKLWKEKIYNMIWLSPDAAAICSGSGLIQRIQLVNGSWVVSSSCHQLPPCKQRWLSCAALCDSRLICSDRDGGLHVFQSQQTDPIQSIHRLHGRHGATSATFWRPETRGGGRLITTGRDGTLRTFRASRDPAGVVQVSSDRLPWDWAAGVTEVNGRRLVAGFHASDFVLWSVEEGRVLWRVTCGGGHRSWALTVTSDLVHLTWLSERRLMHTFCPTANLTAPVIKPGLHVGPALAAVYLGHYPSGGALIATAGEDTTLRVSSLAPGRSPTPLVVLRSHLSSVRALCVVPDPTNSDTYLVSGGGRAQLILWRLCVVREKLSSEKETVTEQETLRERTMSSDCGTLCPSPVTCTELSSHMLRPEGRRRQGDTRDQLTETRYMDLAAQRTTDNPQHYMVAAVGSDGFIRLFTFSDLSPRLSLVRELCAEHHCLLRVHLLGACLFTASTGGSASVWRPVHSPQPEPLRNVSLHQSGVNALDVRRLTGDGVGRLRLASGGDDGAICVTSLPEVDSVGRQLQETTIKHSVAHASQVTGVRCIGPDSLLSVSVDQRFCVWSLVNDRLEQEACHFTSVADPKGITDWVSDDGDVMVLIYGEGLELLRLRDLVSQPKRVS